MKNLLNSERELEDIIYDSLVGESLSIFDDSTVTFVARQFRLDSYGKPDIVYISESDGKKVFNVVELKKGALDLNAYAQICRYVTGVGHFFSELNLNLEKISIKGILVGSSIARNLCFTLNCSSDLIDFYTFNVDDGFFFYDIVPKSYIYESFDASGVSERKFRDVR